MKKILYIAPSSFPVTGSEAIVNIKQLKALSDSNNFEIDLVSRRVPKPIYESVNYKDLGINLKSLNIIDVNNNINLKTIFQHLCCLVTFGFVFKGSHWAFSALSTVKKLVKTTHYDYVITKNEPSLLLGYFLKKHYGLKWVATWNDPFPVNFYPYPYGKGNDYRGTIMDNKMVKMMKKYVDVHIFPSKRLSEHMQKVLELDKNKIDIIPHVVLNNKKIEFNHHNEKLRIIHSGILTPPRTPKKFLIALSKFLIDHPEAKIEVDFLGLVSNEVQLQIEKLHLEKTVFIKKTIPYFESLFQLSNYNLALIIEANCSEGIFLPTKVSDFIQSGIPIFSLSPQVGVLHDLYQNHYVNYFSFVNDEESIYKSINDIYRDFIKGNLNTMSIKIPYDFTEEYMVHKFSNY